MKASFSHHKPRRDPSIPLQITRDVVLYCYINPCIYDQQWVKREKAKTISYEHLKFAAKKHGLSSIATSSAIDRFLSKAAIYMKVNKTGNQSFHQLNAECATQDDIASYQYGSANDTNIDEDMFEIWSIGLPADAFPNKPAMFERPGNEIKGSHILEHASNLSGITARMPSFNKMLECDEAKLRICWLKISRWIPKMQWLHCDFECWRTR